VEKGEKTDDGYTDDLCFLIILVVPLCCILCFRILRRMFFTKSFLIGGILYAVVVRESTLCGFRGTDTGNPIIKGK
jgi:hypothetical protein